MQAYLWFYLIITESGKDFFNLTWSKQAEAIVNIHNEEFPRSGVWMWKHAAAAQAW